MTPDERAKATEEYDGPWCAGKVECAICNAEWVAVWPACAPTLECPECGYMNASPPLDTMEDRR